MADKDMTKWCKSCTFGGRANPDRCFGCLCDMVGEIPEPAGYNKKVS